MIDSVYEGCCEMKGCSGSSRISSPDLQGFEPVTMLSRVGCAYCSVKHTVKILKIGTPEIITIIVLQLEQLDFTVQYCVQKMQTE